MRSSQFALAAWAADAKHQGDCRSWVDVHIGAECIEGWLDARGSGCSMCNDSSSRLEPNFDPAGFVAEA